MNDTSRRVGCAATKRTSEPQNLAQLSESRLGRTRAYSLVVRRRTSPWVLCVTRSVPKMGAMLVLVPRATSPHGHCNLGARPRAPSWPARGRPLQSRTRAQPSSRAARPNGAGAEHLSWHGCAPAGASRKSPRSLVAVELLALGILAACAGGRPPPLEDEPSSTSGGSAGSPNQPEPCAPPPPPDLTFYCNNEVVPVQTAKPNVYFVLDGSGSMQEDFAGESKLLRAKFAIRDVLLEVGHRIRYGAAVFPDTGSSVCAVGTQVFPTTEGDPLHCHSGGNDHGPVLRRFLDSIGFRNAEGGTPTAESLAALAPTLRTLEAPSSVVLITDGAPNCNPGARCEADTCIPNLEHQEFGDRVCGVEVDCCDTTIVGPEARRNCVDSEQSQATVRDLADDGIRTFVVGMPGSELYASVLSQMAEAGGTARSNAATSYYSIQDIEDLSQSLYSIGTQVSLNCEITLRSIPPEPNLINVYFDSDPVQQDADNGWSYQGSAVIELHGKACDVLRSGAVNQLQVVAGCATIK